MSKPKITIHDVNTNQIIERDMTPQEIAQWEADKIASEARQQAKNEADAKRAAAEAKLAALGLTPDDLRSLGLG